MTHELDGILGYIETVKGLATEEVLPMTHAVPFDCPCGRTSLDSP